MYYWYTAEVWWQSPLVYYTGWSWYLFFFYTFIVSYAHIKYDLNEIAQGDDSSSIWHFWKWCTVCFELAFVCQFFTTFGFWVLVYPFYPWPLILTDYMRHGLPLFFLLIDFHMNRIEVESRHWVSSLGWMLCYLFNVTSYHFYH